jgi:excisionase family DNA binding protein
MASESSPLTIPAERLWKARDVAGFLGIGRNAVYEMADRGELPSVRIGSRVRFVPEEIRAWVAQQRSGTATPAPVVPISTGRA